MNNIRGEFQSKGFIGHYSRWVILTAAHISYTQELFLIDRKIQYSASQANLVGATGYKLIPTETRTNGSPGATGATGVPGSTGYAGATAASIRYDKYVLKPSNFPDGSLGSFVTETEGAYCRFGFSYIVKTSSGYLMGPYPLEIRSFCPRMLECSVPKDYNFTDSVAYTGGIKDDIPLNQPSYDGVMTKTSEIDYGAYKTITFSLPKVVTPYHTVANSYGYSPRSKSNTVQVLTVELSRLNKLGERCFGLNGLAWYKGNRRRTFPAVTYTTTSYGSYSDNFFRFNCTTQVYSINIYKDAAQPNYPVTIRIQIAPWVEDDQKVLRRLDPSPVYEFKDIPI
jgi:hypothetical protein